jgi:hypothetical protein
MQPFSGNLIITFSCGQIDSLILSLNVWKFIYSLKISNFIDLPHRYRKFNDRRNDNHEVSFRTIVQVKKNDYIHNNISIKCF